MIPIACNYLICGKKNSENYSVLKNEWYQNHCTLETHIYLGDMTPYHQIVITDVDADKVDQRVNSATNKEKPMVELTTINV
jgi:hypothetical protein